MTISVVVPAHLAGDQFQQCLEALLAAVPAADEIIIVPDGLSAYDWDELRQSGVRVLEPSISAMGPAHARNRGAAAATSDILFFVDADVVIARSALSDIIDLFSKHPEYDAIIGSYDDQPSQVNFLSQYRNLLHHYVHQTSRFDASTFWGACGVIRRSAFLEIGGFDESYAKPSIEDIDLGYRLKRAGKKIMLSKTLQVKHLKYWDARSIVRTDFMQRALPWTGLILREGSLLNDLNLRYSHRISIALVFLLSATILGAFFNSQFLIIALLISMALIVMNRDVYQFFHRKRGFIFMMGVIPWHFLFYLYSGLAFIVGLAQHTFQSHAAAHAP